MKQPLPELKFSKTPHRYKIASTCACGKDNRNNKFVPYEGYTDKGYCHSCGKTFLPELSSLKNQKEHKPLRDKRLASTQPHETRVEPVTPIPFELFEQSVNPPNIQAVRANSSLFQGLLGNKQANIPEALIIETMSRFYIGFSDYRFSFSSAPSYFSPTGANVFWLIDEQNRIRGGQVVLFNQESATCSTHKQPDRHTRPVYLAIESQFRKKRLSVPLWLKKYKDQQGNKMPCLFGLPQLQKEPITKPIAICEAPKTALVGWIYYPEYIWLAIGSRGMLKAVRLKPLAGRNVTLFPDLSKDGSTFELWNKAATDLQNKLKGNWNTSRVLEDAPDLTDEERKGADIADYMLSRWDWKSFQSAIKTSTRTPPPETEAKPPAAAGCEKEAEPLPVLVPEGATRQAVPAAALPAAHFPPPNNKEEEPNINIKELEEFFKTATLPAQPIKLNQCSTITDANTFVRAHLATVKANQGKRVALPYLERLSQLRGIIERV